MVKNRNKKLKVNVTSKQKYSRIFSNSEREYFNTVGIFKTFSQNNIPLKSTLCYKALSF